MWGTSSNDVYAVGYEGTVLTYDGFTWSEMYYDSTVTLRGVWGSDSDDIYAVGTNGTIVHFDGRIWSEMATATTAGLLGVWGSSTTDVYAVGEQGTMLHYNGVDWSEVETGTGVDLYGIWGSSKSDIYTVGGKGTILHYTDDPGDSTCLIQNLYGEYSKKVARGRLFRDERLSTTLAGRIAVRAYYSLSPLLVKTVGQDEVLRGIFRALIDKILVWSEE